MDSDFNIAGLVETKEESNLHLYVGPKEDLEALWPDIYTETKDITFSGYVSNDELGDSFTKRRVWASFPTAELFKHVFGHVLGLGHSTTCDEPMPSVMCTEIAPGSDLLPIDKDVLRYLYHNDMPSGLNEIEVEQKLAELLPVE